MLTWSPMPMTVDFFAILQTATARSKKSRPKLRRLTVAFAEYVLGSFAQVCVGRRHSHDAATQIDHKHIFNNAQSYRCAMRDMEAIFFFFKGFSANPDVCTAV